MTQNEIIELARKTSSHGVEHRSGEVSFVFYNEHLEAFAKIVEAKVEARYMQLFLDPENQPTQFGTATKEYREQEIKDERESCAKLADDIDPVLESVSRAIRARGEA